ncbi:hypothetical protein L202_05706 [Cryptococcus amylolentus CBS 6039]|uniref:Uncharacterized protein n=1 Tax=Cryptococcus amylolentus CBS 6039 TaxID=1295533 RepID=A0A1E3HLE5_9TREE|nr:hypothetical protein L202_05706 [Cryptococcus amylolentus CBS 6039]ODN77183.1 hypothetical protein L202_05706 [Cryptococcus amylolentus CBS 6039]
MDEDDHQRGARPDPRKKRKLIGWFKHIFAKPATGKASTAGPDEQHQLPSPQGLHQSSSIEEYKRSSKPAPRRSGRIKDKQPPVVSQEPALLDETILLEFDQYVRRAWNPTPIPTDERLKGWSDLRLGDLLRLELPEHLSLEVASKRYFDLMRIIFAGEPEASLQIELFSNGWRSPEAFVRVDASRRLGGLVAIYRTRVGNLSHQHSPYSRVREPTQSAVADALYSATKKFKKDGEIAPALRYIAGEIVNEPGVESTQHSERDPPEPVTSEALSTLGVVEANISTSTIVGVLMVAKVKQLQVDSDVRIRSVWDAKKQYEQGLSQLIKSLYHAWEKFGTRFGLFVCGPFFGRLLVTDDKGNIAVECKPCANVGQEYSSLGSYFKEFDYLSLPHSLLLSYTENPQLAEQLGVDDPWPLLNLEGLRKFEELRTHVFKSALDMRVSAALGKRCDSSPTSTSAQGQDSGFPTLYDLSPQDNAAIVKAVLRSPIHWYISARRDAKDRVDEHDVKRFLQAFKAHVLSSSSSHKDPGSHNPDNGEGDNRGREVDSDEGHKDSRHGRSGGYGGYWGGGGGGGQGGKKATGAKSGGPQAKEKDFAVGTAAGVDPTAMVVRSVCRRASVGRGVAVAVAASRAVGREEGTAWKQG